MSVNAIELAVWRATSNPADRDAFREDMAGYLSRFSITGEERDLFLAWNIKELIRRGVNPGLMLGAFSAVHGRGKRTEYLEAMRANAST
jgi:hypothetical protein